MFPTVNIMINEYKDVEENIKFVKYQIAVI